MISSILALGSFLVSHWAYVATAVGGAGGIKGLEATILTIKAWLSKKAAMVEADAKAAAAKAEADAKAVASAIESTVKKVLIDNGVLPPIALGAPAASPAPVATAPAPSPTAAA